MQADETRFSTLWRRLGAVSDPARVYRQLADLYGDPARSYHDLGHIASCLGELDRVASLAAAPDLVETALWFHDALLDPHASDNEERSAVFAVQMLSEAGLGEEYRRRVADMILATRHRGGPVEPDEGLVADIDLSGLALSQERFDANTERIREEARRAGIEDPDPGMFAFLAGLTAREWIYRTAEYQRSHESAARANIERLIGESGLP